MASSNNGRGSARGRGKSNVNPAESSSTAAAGSSMPQESQSSASANTPAGPSRRLGSLNRSTSATLSPAPAARGRGGTVVRPKYAGRRSQAARAELEKEAAALKAAEAAAAAEDARQNARQFHRSGQRGGDKRGRGNRGRGRGGYMGDSNRPKEAIASGPFSAGQVSHEARSSYSKRPMGGSGMGGGFGVFSGGGPGNSRDGQARVSRNGIKLEGGSEHFMDGTSRMRSIKAEDGGYISSDDEEEDGIFLRRQNIDDLQNHTVDLTGVDEEEADDAFAPVRLRRIPVKDRKVGLSAEEISKRPTTYGGSVDAAEHVVDKKKGKARMQEVEIVGSSERARRPTAYSSSSDTEAGDNIKVETMDEDDNSQLQSVETTTMATLDDSAIGGENVAKDPPSSPDTKRKIKEKLRAAGDEATDDEYEYIRPKTPPFPTQQEIDEYRRYWDDLRLIYTELGQIHTKQTASDSTADGTTDVTMDNDGSTKDPEVTAAATLKQQAIRSDQVYLFQFPPVLPDLYPVNVKPDREAPEFSTQSGDTMDVDTPPPPSPPPVAAKDAAEPGIKVEDLPTNPQPHLPSGFVGKLRVHKSGKATLDWGGTPFVIGMGAGADFLQNILIAKIPEAPPDDEADVKPSEPARALGMGQIRGKFVLTPDWDAIMG